MIFLIFFSVFHLQQSQKTWVKNGCWFLLNGYLKKQYLFQCLLQKKKKKKEDEKTKEKAKKKLSQAKYSQITHPSVFYIQVYNNHGIQKLQLWINDKDQCIKISSFSLEIIPLSLLPMHMSCVHAKGEEHKCYGRF